MLSHPNLPTAVSLHVAWGGPRCDGQTRGTTTPHMGRDLASAPWALPLWTPGETSGPLFFTAKQEQEKERERKKMFYLCIYLFGWFGREFFKSIYLGRVISRRWLQPRDILVKCICLIYFLKKCLFLSKRVTKTTEEKKKKKEHLLSSLALAPPLPCCRGVVRRPPCCVPHISLCLQGRGWELSPCWPALCLPPRAWLAARAVPGALRWPIMTVGCAPCGT